MILMILIVFVNKTAADLCNPWDCESLCCNRYGKCTKTPDGDDCLEGYNTDLFDLYNQDICFLECFLCCRDGLCATNTINCIDGYVWVLLLILCIFLFCCTYSYCISRRRKKYNIYKEDDINFHDIYKEEEDQEKS